ncbi:MAG: efflux RND transporter permease subunit, partial [Pseudomonadota bacterium]
MNVSSWSIRHPVPAILLFGLLTLLGIDGFRALGIQNFPDIELPTMIINATLEGAAPAQLETEVARKIEDKVATLGGVEHIRTSITDGSVTIRVEFQIDTPPETALNDVRNALDSVRVDLPADLNPPVVSKVTTTGSPILTFTVQSERMDEEALSWFVDNDLSKALLAVRGVGKVGRVGGVDREIHVDLDPVKMAALGVTTAELSARLKQVGLDASGGRGDIGGSVQSVRTLGAMVDPRELARLELPMANGRTLHLEDLARVSDTIAERSAYALLDGQPVVGFDVTRIKGASEVEVAQRVRAKVADFKAQHPQVRIQEAFNTVAPVIDNFKGSMELLYEGAFLAVLVVWLFLRDWRATLVSAAALPLSIIPTFLGMQVLGFSLNVLTLLSLALVVGILVDDAIVEVENIVRHLRMGKTPYQAAMEAADEIGIAVIATTFTLVAVFMPTAFMGGVPGKFFRPFGITAAVAVMASLLVARLLTPMMAAYLLKPLDEPNREGRLMTAYLRLAGGCLTWRKTTLLLAAMFFIGSLALIPLLPSGFIPPGDMGQTVVKLELQPGTRLDETRAVAEWARERVRQDPDVRQVFTSVGTIGVAGPFGEGGASDVRKASLTLTLTHRTQRPYPQTLIEARLRKALQALPGARVSLGIGSPGEKLQIALAGDDENALRQAAQAVEQGLRGLQGVGNIASSASLQRPEVHIVPDTARAADLGVTAATLANGVRIATAGDFEMILPKLNLPQRQIPIRVRLAREARSDLAHLADLRLPGRTGLVALSDIATVRLGSGPAQIDRLDRSRNVTFDIELAGRIIGEVQAETARLPALNALPP